MNLFAERRQQKYDAKRDRLAKDAASDIICNVVYGVDSRVFIGRTFRNADPAQFMRDVGTLATELSGNVQSYDHEASQEFSLLFNEREGQLANGDRLFLIFKDLAKASVELVPVA